MSPVPVYKEIFMAEKKTAGWSMVVDKCRDFMTWYDYMVKSPKTKGIIQTVEIMGQVWDLFKDVTGDTLDGYTYTPFHDYMFLRDKHGRDYRIDRYDWTVL